MRSWKAGWMAAVVAGLVGVGCGAGMEPAEETSDPGPSATERYLQQMEGDGGGGHPNQCKDKLCFPLKRDKNITHAFIKFDCPVKNFEVFLYTDHFGWENVTDRLKTRGGPCQELNADYRFEVRGPDKEALVCIKFKDTYSEHVKVGAKDENDCSYGRYGLTDFGGGGHGGGDGKECPKCRKDN